MVPGVTFDHFIFTSSYKQSPSYPNNFYFCILLIIKDITGLLETSKEGNSASVIASLNPNPENSRKIAMDTAKSWILYKLLLCPNYTFSLLIPSTTSAF